MTLFFRSALFLRLVLAFACLGSPATAAAPDELTEAPRAIGVSPSKNRDDEPSLTEVKEIGRQRSRFIADRVTSQAEAGRRPESERRQASLGRFEAAIKPILEENCVDCHGPDSMEGNIRIDTLDPDLSTGGDTDWWSEVFGVVAKGEMPPPGSSPRNPV